MIILPIINFVLPLMITCLVLVDDPPRSSECRKKIELKVFQNKKNEAVNILDSIKSDNSGSTLLIFFKTL